jgi:hypothetical protein
VSRIRSPNYPGISLTEALERVGALFEKEHQHTMARDVALKGLGYSGANGASLTALSAVRKYGLVSKNGEEYRVTDRAVTILHPHSPEEKAQALEVAAGEPALFAELLGHFNGELPSDDNLRSYLVRKGFSSGALSGVIQSFRDTMKLVSPESREYTEKNQSQETHALRADPLIAPKSTLGTPPLGITSVAIGDDRITVTATLLSAQSVQKLIDKLSAVKKLLPEEPEKDEAASVGGL